ncbi:MAG: ribonuclease H-like domain-containing protein [Eubacterium sp.]|nr:ribonuclease H-like domain-containing protein [Eubacterium sp.]
MEIIEEIVIPQKVQEYDMVNSFFKDKKVAMFDIETTGLSPMTSFTYIIGINVFENGKWKIIQLFNDDGKSEPEMISTFQKYLEDIDILIEFNGDTFDIPYIKKRMSAVNQKFHISLTDNFNTVETCDLLKIVRKYKYSLGLPNVKQKTVEKYLGIDRVDMYNGGQLIDVYLGYLAMRDEKSRSLVLQHNRDDMEGMIFLSSILKFEALISGDFKIEKISTEMKKNTEDLLLIINGRLEHPLNRDLFSTAYSIDVMAEENRLSIKIPVLSGNLKFYYGRSEKEGYDFCKGLFVPQPGFVTEKIPCFKYNFRDKTGYIRLSDDFLGNDENIYHYSVNICKNVMLFKGKNQF